MPSATDEDNDKPPSLFVLTKGLFPGSDYFHKRGLYHMLQASHKPKGALPEDEKKQQLEAIKERSKDALTIRILAPGFQRHNFELCVKGNILTVTGMALTPSGPEVVKGDVNLEGIVYDAKTVEAAMKLGYLQVTFPHGTKETMVEEPFMVGWEKDGGALIEQLVSIATTGKIQLESERAKTSMQSRLKHVNEGIDATAVVLRDRMVMHVVALGVKKEHMQVQVTGHELQVASSAMTPVVLWVSKKKYCMMPKVSRGIYWMSI